MKRAAVLFLLVVLFVPLLSFSAGQALEGGLYTPVITLRATTENGKIPTRSGPSTSYTEPGSFDVLGMDIRIISRFDDGGGVCWLQCEVPVGSTYRRLYTGLRRFEPTPADFSILDVPLERPLNQKARVTVTCNALYGPGGNYGTYGDLQAKKGATVTLISIEGEYAQVEWKGSKEIYRVWLPVSNLRY